MGCTSRAKDLLYCRWAHIGQPALKTGCAVEKCGISYSHCTELDPPNSAAPIQNWGGFTLQPHDAISDMWAEFQTGLEVICLYPQVLVWLFYLLPVCSSWLTVFGRTSSLLLRHYEFAQSCLCPRRPRGSRQYRELGALGYFVHR